MTRIPAGPLQWNSTNSRTETMFPESGVSKKPPINFPTFPYVLAVTPGPGVVKKLPFPITTQSSREERCPPLSLRDILFLPVLIHTIVSSQTRYLFPFREPGYWLNLLELKTNPLPFCVFRDPLAVLGLSQKKKKSKKTQKKEGADRRKVGADGFLLVRGPVKMRRFASLYV